MTAPLYMLRTTTLARRRDEARSLCWSLLEQAAEQKRRADAYDAEVRRRQAADGVLARETVRVLTTTNEGTTICRR